MSQSRASGDEPLFPEPQGLAEKRKLPSDDLPRGASIGRYLIIERLGSGGMGVVYSAYDPDLNRRVAIKLLRSQPGALASQGRARLLREAQSMARLSHPNVVAVFDVGVAFDQVFVAMEFIEGATLGEWLVRTRRTEDILRVFVDAGQGLAAAHAAGIVHRDIKPGNFPLLG
jgi:serine/threonine protein kinase